MEVAGGAETEIRPLKPCLLRRNHSREQHGVAASCLEELRNKACDILAIDKSLAPITLVLAEDGTIVDDDDYFLCLPSNTKFVALASNEKWMYNNSDGGTAWISQESLDVDETDTGAGLRWRNVARQLKEDVSSIILLSEADLQVLIDAPCSDLAQELRQSCVTVQGLQNTLQQVLDQREEARQSKQLLELYLQALEKEGGILSKQQANTEMARKVTTGGRATGIYQGEVRGVNKHPTMHRTVPTTTQNDLVQIVNGAEAEKPYSLSIIFMFKLNTHLLTYLHFCAMLCNKKKLYFKKKGKKWQGKVINGCHRRREGCGRGTGDNGRHERGHHPY
uniref:CIDE-N domain-containing protein n=1 Tax=Felis catus TaxID=9685 RepID=A0ABI8A196_FELCA